MKSDSPSPADRFRAALAASQRLHTVADVARKARVKPGTLNQQLTRGSFPADMAKRYADALGVRVDWLLFGDGAMSDAASEAQAARADATPPDDPVERASLIVNEVAKIVDVGPRDRARLTGIIHKIIVADDLSKI